LIPFTIDVIEALLLFADEEGGTIPGSVRATLISSRISVLAIIRKRMVRIMDESYIRPVTARFTRTTNRKVAKAKWKFGPIVNRPLRISR
jgi:hypothetical protein